MDINLLVVSAGNSRIALGAFAGGELQFVTRVPVKDRDAWRKAVAEAWGKLEHLSARAVAGATVNRPLVEELEHILHEVTGQDVQWVGRQIDLPIEVKTENPAGTGVDRILNVAAAYEQMESACVVVDAGTALTVDCCNDLGEFIGGAIAPGAAMMLESLHEKTAGLPKVELESVKRGAWSVERGGIGKNTESAIIDGVFYAARGLVREIVENFATEIGRWPEVIATGGDAKVLFEGWDVIHATAPDLTLYGIALAYAEHHIKHDT